MLNCGGSRGGGVNLHTKANGHPTRQDKRLLVYLFPRTFCVLRQAIASCAGEGSPRLCRSPPHGAASETKDLARRK